MWHRFFGEVPKWDFGSIPPLVAPSSRAILRGLKRKMEPRRWQQVSLPVIMQQRDRPLRDTTLRLRESRLYHCLKTELPPSVHFRQLAQLPHEWSMARLSLDFPSIAAGFSRLLWKLETPASSVRGRPLGRQRQSLLRCFRALVLLTHCVDCGSACLLCPVGD